jgi:hypothetical protein
MLDFTGEVVNGRCTYSGPQSLIKPTRGDAMSNHPKTVKSDSSVDAWAIFFLIILVVGAAVFWVSHQ